MKAKIRRCPPADRRHHHRRGECEIGFQQVSELVHIKGIDYIGPLPKDIQRITVFATGVHANATNPDGAKRWRGFWRRPQPRCYQGCGPGAALTIVVVQARQRAGLRPSVNAVAGSPGIGTSSTGATATGTLSGLRGRFGRRRPMPRKSWNTGLARSAS